MFTYYVYILASKKYGTLYVGVTNELTRRTTAHKDGTGSEFTKKYKVNKLVHFEEYNSIEQAIIRESNIKAWKRNWKIKLIEENNPDWKDLTINF